MGLDDPKLVGIRKMIIDIDGCVCEHVDNEHAERMITARPIPGAVETVNRWYDEGRYICFFTARRDEHRGVTEGWLKEHGFKYHQIIFNKPRGGDYHYIDDMPVRATRFKGRFGEFVAVKKEILVFREVDDSSNRRILVADPIAREAIDYLRSQPGLEVDVRTGLGAEELSRVVGNYSALIVRSATKVTREIIDRATNLRVVGRAGVGLDNIDVEYAQERGIKVLNIPRALSVSVAELTIGLILALARHIPQAHASVKAGRWEKSGLIGTELYKKTLGIIGLGGIGRMVAVRAQAFGMRVIAYDSAFYTETLEEVFTESDFITIHVPLTPKTHHLIGEREIAMMKDGVRIINCARGGIVDEEALYRAIVSGKVAGAAVDVLEKEPPQEDSPLLKHPNVIFTPHIGASTHEAQVSVGVTIAKKVVEALFSRTEVGEEVKIG
jgi:phosphoglycerate dehydrogenase-like enzyme